MQFYLDVFFLVTKINVLFRVLQTQSATKKNGTTTDNDRGQDLRAPKSAGPIKQP